MFLKSSRYYTLKSTFDLMTMYAYSFFFKSMFQESRTSQENYYANPIISSSSNNLIENINIFLFLFF